MTANCYHPGFVRTGWNANNGVLTKFVMASGGRLVGRSPAKGADTMVWLALSPEVEGKTGGFWFDRQLATPTAIARDPVVAESLWELSEEQTGVRA